LATKHGPLVREALDILARRFCDDAKGEGYRKDGPVAAARFEVGDGDDGEGGRERRALRQRQVTDVVSRLLAKLAVGKGE
jgi:hypothetical protein